MFSYAKGKYLPTEQLSLPLTDDIVGTIRGYRIFTALRTKGQTIFHLDDHIERLFKSAKIICMDLPQTRTELKKIVEETVSRNDGDLLLEIIYSGGKANASGVAPAGSADLYIAVFPLKLPPERWYQGGVKLASYPYQRQWPEVKLLNYVGAVIAHQTVVKKFKANEALFLSPDKRQIVLEGTTFNFFIVCGNTVITHPLDGKILAGITRKIVLKLAKKIKGLRVKENYFSYQNLSQANEAFLTSSTRNVVPVTKIDNIVIGSGKPGKVTQQLGEMFAEYLERYQA